MSIAIRALQFEKGPKKEISRREPLSGYEDVTVLLLSDLALPANQAVAAGYVHRCRGQGGKYLNAQFSCL